MKDDRLGEREASATFRRPSRLSNEAKRRKSPPRRFATLRGRRKAYGRLVRQIICRHYVLDRPHPVVLGQQEVSLPKVLWYQAEILDEPPAAQLAAPPGPWRASHQLTSLPRRRQRHRQEEDMIAKKKEDMIAGGSEKGGRKRRPRDSCKIQEKQKETEEKRKTRGGTRLGTTQITRVQKERRAAKIGQEGGSSYADQHPRYPAQLFRSGFWPAGIVFPSRSEYHVSAVRSPRAASGSFWGSGQCSSTENSGRPARVPTGNFS